jgi:hypothetical protein
MDCFRRAKNEVGTAPFPKAKEYQKLQTGAYNQEEDSESEIDLGTTDDNSQEEDSGEEDSEEEGSDTEEDEDEDRLE